MKKLALLFALTICATVFAPLASAQDCSWAGIPCSGHQCDSCHYEVQICGEGGSAYCYDCYTPCLMIAGEKPNITHAVQKRVTAQGRTPLTDLGAAFLAAVVPDFLRNPLAKGRLPKGHPDISPKTGEKLLERMAARNQLANEPGCKAPATVQLIAASMLRK